VKDQGLMGQPLLEPTLNHLPQGLRQYEHPPVSGFVPRGWQAHCTAGQVNHRPGEARDLTFTPATVVAKIKRILIWGWQVLPDSQVLLMLHKALSGVCLLEPLQAGFVFYPALADGQGEHTAQGSQVFIHGGGCGPQGETLLPVALHILWGNAVNTLTSKHGRQVIHPVFCPLP
jgi:hypothetical protein